MALIRVVLHIFHQNLTFYMEVFTGRHHFFSPVHLNNNMLLPQACVPENSYHFGNFGQKIQSREHGRGVWQRGASHPGPAHGPAGSHALSMASSNSPVYHLIKCVCSSSWEYYRKPISGFVKIR